MAKKETEDNHTARLDKEFFEELEGIIKTRKEETKIDKKKKSIKILTGLILKHDAWPKIKKDMLEVNLENKQDE